MNSQWNIEEALWVATVIENLLTEKNLNAHVCLGGSVLFKQYSDNDVDFFIYNHGKAMYDKNQIIQDLNERFKRSLAVPVSSLSTAKSSDYLGETTSVFTNFVYETFHSMEVMYVSPTPDCNTNHKVNIFFLKKIQ